MVQMKFDINILTKCFSLTIWISYLSGLMISFHVSAVLYRFITIMQTIQQRPNCPCFIVLFRMCQSKDCLMYCPQNLF